MAKTNKKTKELSASQKVGIGVGLTTAAVAAAGAYFLYGSKNAAKNRKTVKSWALKAKAEVLEGLEDAKEMTWDEYEHLVDTVTKSYAQFKNASKKDLKEFSNEMKAHWQKIAKENPKKPAKKVAKKAAKKAVKKSPKKVTRKKA